MIKQFEHLTESEKELLLKAPVLVSVLASTSHNEVNKKQKADAIKLAHLKTFTAKPLLLSYYNEVDKIFKDQFEATVKEYYPFDEIQRSKLKQELIKVHKVIDKLDKSCADTLKKSLESYANHVKRADHSVFQDFIFAFPIPGLSA